MKEKLPYIVTSALPYANGPIHIGHLAGAYLPADIYTRFLKLMGEDVIYICGTDEHGTPITFLAEKEKVSPSVVVDRYAQSIHHSLLSAGIEFDYFGRTSLSYHAKEVQSFFLELLQNGFLELKEEEQFYCSATEQFLPDRYIEGECPYCGNPRARGDECSKCGKWLEAEKLKNPKSSYCPSDISKKKTQHWYLSLDKLQGDLEKWIDSKTDWKDNVVSFVKSWFKEGLRPRAITRDLSWGVPIPLDDPNMKGKVLYVWFDAPIGYLSMTKEWACTVKKDEKLWEKYWMSANSRLVHFIGKDNIPFHAIVWPGMLIGQEKNYTLPYQIPANEHLTIEGQKISSSRGNAVWIEEVVEVFGKDYLRMYLAIIAPENRDADFSWDHFASTINTELVNNLGNLFQRITTFICSHFEGIVPPVTKLDAEQTKLLADIKEALSSAKSLYQDFRVKEVCKTIFDLCRKGNAYFQKMEPWKLISTNPHEVGNICNILVRLLETVGLLALPIIPSGAHSLLARIGGTTEALVSYDVLDSAGRKIEKGSPLFPRIESSVIQKQKDILTKRMEGVMRLEEQEQEGEKSPNISIQDFSKMSLQSAKVLQVEAVPKSNKLLRFVLQTSEGERQILSGIANWYPDPQVLLGKYIVFVANLPPRMMMGFESNGMILSAENSKGELEVIQVSEKIGEGAIVK